jgi:ABC-2 type transport system permease protein
MRRDRLTFAMMIGVPLMQLILFGYAINTDPKYLPTALLAADQGVFARSLVRALENSGYFEVVRQATSEAEADDLLVRGDVQFVISIPEDFERELLRGQRPAVLVEADATDPVATGNALAALASLNRTALLHDLKGPLASLSGVEPAFELRVHRRYNPEGATEYNIVPGLIGTILTMTMVMMTAIAVTRERERGTMENLLAMPVRPFEVMLARSCRSWWWATSRSRSSCSPAGSCSACRCWARSGCSRSRSCCSSPPTWPSASPSRPWPRTSCRQCR